MNRRPTTILAALALAVAAPAAAQPETPPPPAPLRPYTVPPVEDFRLDNGVRVVVVRDAKLPIVTGRFVVDAGAALEPADDAGVAVLTGNLLDQGVPGMSAAEITAEMERLGAQFGTSASFSYAYATVTASRSAFPEALALAARTVKEPAFPEPEFTRVRAQTLAQHAQLQASVTGLANTAFSRAIFEPSAPYARQPMGTPATLQGLSRDDVAAWHRQWFAPSTTTLLLVGDITVDEARPLAERVIGDWRKPAVTVPEVANPARPVAETRVILIDRPGSVQSGVVVGQAGPGFGDPDYVDLLALSQVLGGGFKARLMSNLRERHGWTYASFSSLNALRGAGTFSASAQVRTNATDSAVAEMVGEFRRIVAEPVPEAELRASMNNLVGSFPSSVQTVQGLAQRIQNLLLYDMPLDWYADYRERLAAVTPADVARVGRARVTPDALTVVVAGDLAQIEAPIRALDLGTVEVWDADGNRVR